MALRVQASELEGEEPGRERASERRGCDAVN